MIKGIGIDLIEFSRFENMINSRFIKKVYSDDEISEITTNIENLSYREIQKFCGNFAVKEAVVKAFGTGFRGISFKDVKVFRNEYGAPYVVLDGKAKDIYGENSILISITNTKESVAAVAVME